MCTSNNLHLCGIDWLWFGVVHYGPKRFNLENQSKFVFLYIKIRSIEFKDVTSINLLCHDK